MTASEQAAQDDLETRASNGREGLDLISRAPPDLLVIDQMMPEMTGVEVIRELRSHLETATLPVVMITAHDSEDLESEVFAAGADDYVQKPISIERLRQWAKRLPASLERAASRG